MVSLRTCGRGHMYVIGVVCVDSRTWTAKLCFLFIYLFLPLEAVNVSATYNN